jgi:hypothetical protein
VPIVLCRKREIHLLNIPDLFLDYQIHFNICDFSLVYYWVPKFFKANSNISIKGTVYQYTCIRVLEILFFGFWFCVFIFLRQRLTMQSGWSQIPSPPASASQVLPCLILWGFWHYSCKYNTNTLGINFWKSIIKEWGLKKLFLFLVLIWKTWQINFHRLL